MVPTFIFCVFFFTCHFFGLQRRPCARRYDYIGRKDPVTGEITCPWRKGRGKVQSGGSSGVQMAG